MDPDLQQTQEPYYYADDNPVSAIDPTGAAAKKTMCHGDENNAKCPWINIVFNPAPTKTFVGVSSIIEHVSISLRRMNTRFKVGQRAWFGVQIGYALGPDGEDLNDVIYQPEQVETAGGGLGEFLDRPHNAWSPPEVDGESGFKMTCNNSLYVQAWLSKGPLNHPPRGYQDQAYAENDAGVQVVGNCGDSILEPWPRF